MLTSFIIAATIAITPSKPETITYVKVTPSGGQVRVTIDKQCDSKGCVSGYYEEPIEAPTPAPHGDIPEEFTIPETDR